MVTNHFLRFFFFFFWENDWLQASSEENSSLLICSQAVVHVLNDSLRGYDMAYWRKLFSKGTSENGYSIVNTLCFCVVRVSRIFLGTLFLLVHNILVTNVKTENMNENLKFFDVTIDIKYTTTVNKYPISMDVTIRFGNLVWNRVDTIYVQNINFVLHEINCIKVCIICQT